MKNSIPKGRKKISLVSCRQPRLVRIINVCVDKAVLRDAKLPIPSPYRFGVEVRTVAAWFFVAITPLSVVVASVGVSCGLLLHACYRLLQLTRALTNHNAASNLRH